MQGTVWLFRMHMCCLIRAIKLRHEFCGTSRLGLHVFSVPVFSRQHDFVSDAKTDFIAVMVICQFHLVNFGYKKIILCLFDIEGQLQDEFCHSSCPWFFIWCGQWHVNKRWDQPWWSAYLQLTGREASTEIDHVHYAESHLRESFCPPFLVLSSMITQDLHGSLIGALAAVISLWVLGD